MTIIMEKGEGSYLTGVMFSPPSDFFEGTLDHVAQKAKGYAGPDGHLACMPAPWPPPQANYGWKCALSRILKNISGKQKGGNPWCSSCMAEGSSLTMRRGLKR